MRRKYNAKNLNDIGWVVVFGRGSNERYYKTTYGTEHEAREAALIKNIQHYRDLQESAFNDLQKLNESDEYDTVILYGEDHEITMGDLLC
jgi:hypothetical protein